MIWLGNKRENLLVMSCKRPDYAGAALNLKYRKERNVRFYSSFSLPSFIDYVYRPSNRLREATYLAGSADDKLVILLSSFFFFFRKQDLTFQVNCLNEGSMHKMSNPVFRVNKKNSSKCLLKFLLKLRVLSIGFQYFASVSVRLRKPLLFFIGGGGGGGRANSADNNFICFFLFQRI